MSFDDNTLISQLQAAQAKMETMKQAYEPAIERVKQFKANFGVREKSDGSIDIDFEKFVERLGIEGWLELRAIGDARHNVSGAPSEKPRVKVAAGTPNAA